MYQPVFELASFDILDQNARTNLVGLLVEALIGVNRKWLRRYPNTPPFYKAAPSYALKNPPLRPRPLAGHPPDHRVSFGGLRRGPLFRLTRRSRGHPLPGKDFVAWRVAEMREAGYPDVGPRIITKEAGGVVVYHVQVRNDVTIEDPSVAMGMPQNMTPAQIRGLIR